MFWIPPIRLMRLMILGLLLLLAACSAAEEGASRSLQLTSPAFTDGQPLPKEFTCDGDDISPALQWDNLPTGTTSLALIMDDPDAPGGTWVHWVMYDMPGESTGLAQGVLAGNVPGGGTQGSNSWNRNDYGGPCPPTGSHRYFFKLYALDGPLNLGPGADKDTLLEAMEGHILAQGRLMGTYERE